MTTIAYRDGVMAADTGVWIGEACHTCARKLIRGKDGTLYGVAGNAAEATTFIKWVESGKTDGQPIPERDEKGSSFIVLAVPPSGPIRIITARGDEEYNAEYFSIGGGSATAFGALFAGASAVMAIEATIEHGSAAHGRVESIHREPVLSMSERVLQAMHSAPMDLVGKEQAVRPGMVCYEDEA